MRLCVVCDDPINGGQRWEVVDGRPIHSSCGRPETAPEPEPAPVGGHDWETFHRPFHRQQSPRSYVPFSSRPRSGYADRLEREAFAHLHTRGWELVRAAVDLDELSLTVPRRKRRAIMAAVVRELWREPWESIAREVGYRWATEPVTRARRVCDEEGNAVQIVYELVRECVLDEFLSTRAEIVEELEMLAEVGWLSCSEDDSGKRSYTRTGRAE